MVENSNVLIEKGGMMHRHKVCPMQKCNHTFQRQRQVYLCVTGGLNLFFRIIKTIWWISENKNLMQSHNLELIVKLSLFKKDAVKNLSS